MIHWVMSNNRFFPLSQWSPPRGWLTLNQFYSWHSSITICVSTYTEEFHAQCTEEAPIVVPHGDGRYWPKSDGERFQKGLGRCWLNETCLTRYYMLLYTYVSREIEDMLTNSVFLRKTLKKKQKNYPFIKHSCLLTIKMVKDCQFRHVQIHIAII